MKKFIGVFSVLLLLMSFMFMVWGCNMQSGQYTYILIKNDLGSYSLEYPSTYERDIWDNLEFRIPYTHFILQGPETSQEAEIFDPDTGKTTVVSGKRGTCSISVTIANYKVGFGDSYTYKEKMASVLEGEARWANFKLLERTQSTVSGIVGEKIEYLVDRLMPIPVENGKNLDYYCSVYFDYNGLVWEITAQCIQELQTQVKADFDHIIQSFKIIE